MNTLHSATDRRWLIKLGPGLTMFQLRLAFHAFNHPVAAFDCSSTAMKANLKERP